MDEPSVEAGARRLVVRLVASAAAAAAGLVAATGTSSPGDPDRPALLALAAFLILLPLAVGLRHTVVAARQGQRATTAFLLAPGATTGLALLGLRVFGPLEAVPWPALLVYAVFVAAPTWALAGAVAKDSWSSS